MKALVDLIRHVIIFTPANAKICINEFMVIWQSGGNSVYKCCNSCWQISVQKQGKQILAFTIQVSYKDEVRLV